jgi:hypothetical protein
MEFSREARRLYGVRSSQTLLIRGSAAAASRSQIPLNQTGSSSLCLATRVSPADEVASRRELLAASGIGVRKGI